MSSLNGSPKTFICSQEHKDLNANKSYHQHIDCNKFDDNNSYIYNHVFPIRKIMIIMIIMTILLVENDDNKNPKKSITCFKAIIAWKYGNNSSKQIHQFSAIIW